MAKQSYNKEYYAEYRKKNKDWARSQQKIWRELHKDELKQKKKDYYFRTKPKREFMPYCSYTEEQFKAAIASSKCWADVMRALNLSHSGAILIILKKNATRYCVDFSHFQTPASLSSKRLKGVMKIPDELVFKKESSINPKTLVQRFKLMAAKPYVCEICNQPPFHNGKKLVIQLDHINGICNDNRVENLRWLCPNCHTQTPTYAKRNVGKVPDHISKKRRLRKKSLRISY